MLYRQRKVVVIGAGSVGATYIFTYADRVGWGDCTS